MSLEAHLAALRTPAQRELSDRLVLIVLANESAADGANARPGMDYLSSLSGVGRRTIPRATDRLEEDLYIWVHRRGNGRSNHYVLTVPGLDPIEPRRWSCRDCLRAAEAYRHHLHATTEGLIDDPNDDLLGLVDNHPDQCHRCTGRVTTEPVPPWHQTSATTSATEPRNQCHSLAPDPDPWTLTRDADGVGAPARKQALAEALLAACHPRVSTIADLTASAAGRLRKAAAELGDSGVTPDEIGPVVARYRREWSVECTPTALAANWHRFVIGPPTRNGTAAAVPSPVLLTGRCHHCDQPAATVAGDVELCRDCGPPPLVAAVAS